MRRAQLQLFEYLSEAHALVGQVGVHGRHGRPRIDGTADPLPDEQAERSSGRLGRGRPSANAANARRSKEGVASLPLAQEGSSGGQGLEDCSPISLKA